MALNDEINKALTQHLLKVKDGIAARMEQQHRTATGRSVASLQVVQTGTTQMALVGGPQWAVMQKGRKAGKVPANFRDIIKQWIVAKGISVSGGQKGLNTAAYLISRSIMKKGTRLYRSHGHDDIYDSVINSELTNLAESTAGIISVHVDRINDKYVKA